MNALLPILVCLIASPPQPSSVSQIQGTWRQDDPAVQLAWTYLSATNSISSAQAPTDRRPAHLILADLKRLSPQDIKKVGAYIASNTNHGRGGLDLMRILDPKGFKAYQIALLNDRWWFPQIARQLAATNDPVVVRQIFDATPEKFFEWGLTALATPQFLPEVSRVHRTDPSKASAFVIGCFASKAKGDVLKLAKAEEKLRVAMLHGLSNSMDPPATGLLERLHDRRFLEERTAMAARYVRDGPKSVPVLLKLLKAEDMDSWEIARRSLSEIKSYKGAMALFTKLDSTPDFSLYDARTAQTNPAAALDYIKKAVRSSERDVRLRALELSHQMPYWEPKKPGDEPPLLEPLLFASKDIDSQIRYLAAQGLSTRAWDAGHRPGQRALARLVQMMTQDPSNRVRHEAAVQASQYPCPDLIPLFRQMSQDRRYDAETRAGFVGRISSLQETLRHRQPVRLRKAQ